MNTNKQTVMINTQKGFLLHSEWLQKILFCFALAAVTGIFAQVKWYIPGNPVPFTLQTAAVIISALWLKRWGGISQVIYLLLGFCGVPWFANQASGFGMLSLSTLGYLLGFVFTAFIGGWFVEKYYSRFKIYTFFGLFLICILFTHGFGLLYLRSWMFITHKAGYSFSRLLVYGTLPFILFDGLKIFLVTWIYDRKGVKL